MEIYEYKNQELDEVLSFRNSVFGHVSREHWKAMNCTAIVAREAGKLAGFIPLQFRRQCLAEDVTIPVVYENAVGVAEGMRSRGIGSRMIDKVAHLVSNRVDALMVIRGEEKSNGYRFYRKTGHGDVSYSKTYELPPWIELTAENVEGISIPDKNSWINLEPGLLSLYKKRYGRFGGGQKRVPGYWQMILDGHVYRERKWWLVTYFSEANKLAGYLVAVNGLGSQTENVHIYEVVGEDEDSVERLIKYAQRLAPGKQIVFPCVSLANPVIKLLRKMGFIEKENTTHIMAYILRSDRIFRALSAGSDLINTLSLTVSTPHRTLIVNDPLKPCHKITMETKESLLSRLFCCRLDLEKAIDMELVRWNCHDPGLKRELYQVFHFAEWVMWFTDYV